MLATIGRMSIGVLLGSMAGYFRGWVDTIVSRLTEITMAFPALLFIIALASTVGAALNKITSGSSAPGSSRSSWSSRSSAGTTRPASSARRCSRSARRSSSRPPAWSARATCGSSVPPPAAPGRADHRLLDARLRARNILVEAGLSFLGVGIQLPTASWGNLLPQAPEYYTTQPWLMVWPGLAVLITTLAFNLLGDGLRDAFDPRSTH